MDTGNLINSHETEVIDLGTDLVGEIRVTADYALHVHEAPPGTHFRKPGASSKFLEKALYEEQKKVADILIGGGKL